MRYNDNMVKKLIIIFVAAFVLYILTNSLRAADNNVVGWDDIVSAISTVESGNNPLAVGDNGYALGNLQIHDVMVQDYNRITKTSNLSHIDVYDNPALSRAVMITTFEHYWKAYSTNSDVLSVKAVAYFWNGGPEGLKIYLGKVTNKKTKEANLQKYYAKVIKALNEQ